MKKAFIVLLALLCVSGLAFAADKPSEGGITPYVDKGELLVNAGIGWGGLSGGAEFTLARIDIAKVIPITFGAAGRAFVDPGIFYSGFSTFTFGAGGFGTAHVGFKNINLPSGLSWVSNFDAYVGLGLGFASATASTTYAGYTFKPGIGISTFEGASYYLNDKLAINFEFGYIGRVTYEYAYWGYSGGWPLYYSTVGVVLKL
jgi:hypothetical protein